MTKTTLYDTIKKEEISVNITFKRRKNKMKKLIAVFILMLSMIFVMASCNKSEASANAAGKRDEYLALLNKCMEDESLRKISMNVPIDGTFTVEGLDVRMIGKMSEEWLFDGTNYKSVETSKMTAVLQVNNLIIDEDESKETKWYIKSATGYDLYLKQESKGGTSYTYCKATDAQFALLGAQSSADFTDDVEADDIKIFVLGDVVFYEFSTKIEGTGDMEITLIVKDEKIEKMIMSMNFTDLGLEDASIKGVGEAIFDYESTQKITGVVGWDYSKAKEVSWLDFKELV